MTPDDRKYVKSHEWIKVDGELALVGITDHAQESLGDITFIDPPGVGDVKEQGADVAVIESVKAASDIYAPVSGVVVAVNEELEDAPERVNEDPYGAGWIFKLKNFDADQLDGLLDAAGYEASLGEGE